MRLEVGNALPDLFSLGQPPIHGRRPVRFDEGTRQRWFDANALHIGHRFVDQRIEIVSPISHFYFPPANSYRHRGPATLRKLGGVDKVDNRCQRRADAPARAYLELGGSISACPAVVIIGTSSRISTRPMSINILRSTGLTGSIFVRFALISRNVQRWRTASLRARLAKPVFGSVISPSPSA